MSTPSKRRAAPTAMNIEAAGARGDETPSPLDGIDFADETGDEPAREAVPPAVSPLPPPGANLPPSTPDAPRVVVPMSTARRMNANQIAALEAAERMNRERLIDRAPASVPLEVPAAAPASSAPKRATRYRLLREARIKGPAGTISLKAGRVISSNQYDIAAVRRSVGPDGLEELAEEAR